MIKDRNIALDANISASKLLGGGLLGAGRVIYVAPSSSAYYTYWDGKVPAGDLFTNLALAYAATTTGQNDVIILSPGTHTLTAMLTVSKDKVHFIGAGAGGRFVQHDAKVYMGVTGVATDLAPVLVTGNRCSFNNIKVENASTTNETLYGFIDNGEGTCINNCSFVKTAGLDDAGHAHFWMAGDSLTMRECTIGQSNTPSTAAGFGILIDGKTGGASDVVKENFLDNIFINMSVANGVVGTSFAIKIADTAALNFGNVIRNLVANNFQPVGAAAVTDAVGGPAAATSGTLSLVSPSFFGFTGVANATVSNVNICLPGGTAAAAGGLSAALAG